MAHRGWPNVSAAAAAMAASTRTFCRITRLHVLPPRLQARCHPSGARKGPSNPCCNCECAGLGGCEERRRQGHLRILHLHAGCLPALPVQAAYPHEPVRRTAHLPTCPPPRPTACLHRCHCPPGHHAPPITRSSSDPVSLNATSSLARCRAGGACRMLFQSFLNCGYLATSSLVGGWVGGWVAAWLCGWLGGWFKSGCVEPGNRLDRTVRGSWVVHGLCRLLQEKLTHDAACRCITQVCAPLSVYDCRHAAIRVGHSRGGSEPHVRGPGSK